MTAEDIERIETLIRKAEMLPAELFSPLDPASDKDELPEETAQLEAARIALRDARAVALEAEACLSALLGAENKYAKGLATLRFDESLLARPDKARATWSTETRKLREHLAQAKIEGQERARIQSRASSWKVFFRSEAARAIWLGAGVSLVAAFFSKDAIAEWFGGPRWNKLGGAFTSIEVVEHERIVDLTEWTRTPKGDTSSQTGKSVFISNLKLRKVRDEGTKFCVTAASSGSTPAFTSSTHQISQNPIEMKLVGWPNLPNQVLAVLEIPPETKGNVVFDANINSIRYRGFSDDQAEWCSLGIWHPTRKLVMVVKFPPGKMGRDFVFKTAFFYDRNNFELLAPDADHCLITPKSNSITWTVDHPILGNAYRIDWNW